MVWSLSRTLAYTQRVGGLSLPCLVLGGGILILFGINVLTGISNDESDQDLASPLPRASAIAFRVGSHLDVQFWLAVLGVSFGLLSYGLSGTYVHLFDLWCTHQTAFKPGLDYARYLNSQPRASGFGFRGFWFFAALQHLVTVLGIIASVGYKFAVIQVSGRAVFHVNQTAITLLIPSTDAFLKDASASPWLGDLNPKWGDTTRAFIHHDSHLGNDPISNSWISPPATLIMAGQANCDEVFGILDAGKLVTLEVVMVATRSASEQAFEPPTSDLNTGQDWIRIEREGPGWLWDIQPRINVGYRVDPFWGLQVQWAESANQTTSNGTQPKVARSQQPIVQTLIYNMSLSVAEVTRYVESGGCPHISHTDLLFNNIGHSINAMSMDPIGEVDLPNKHWITAVIQDHAAGAFEAIGVIVRNAMVTLTPSITNRSGYSLGHAPQPTVPWGFFPNATKTQFVKDSNYNRKNKYENGITTPSEPNNTDVMQDLIKNWPGTNTSEWQENSVAMREWMRKKNGMPDYPYYQGLRVSSCAGSYDKAAWIFITLGIIAFFLAGLRLFAGPAQLTSWMGQHVYLALEGKIQKEGAEKLACGRQPARNLGTLRMEVTEHGLREHFPSWSLADHAQDYEHYLGRFLNGL